MYINHKAHKKHKSLDNTNFLNKNSGQTLTKDYKIGICCFYAKHAALKKKSKKWLARNQDKVSEWGDMSIRISEQAL